MSAEDSIPSSDDTVVMDYGLYEAPSEAGVAMPVPAAQRLGVLEILDKNGTTIDRVFVTHWPVTVGRAMTCDLVVDDAHMAAEHLRISELDATFVVVEVLDTVNGVRRGYGTLMQRGMRFDWSGADDLVLGRWRLRLRLRNAPQAAEQRLPTFAWRTTMITVALVLALMGVTLVDAWLQPPYSAKFVQAALPSMAMLLGGVALWAGLWALASKLFTGHLQFLRHVRIVCGVLLLGELVSLAAYALAFMFSWESLAQSSNLLNAPVLGAGIFLQLMAIAPNRRKGLMLWVTGAVLAAVLVWAGTNWQKNKRVSNQLYLSALFPPGLRMVAAVPVEQLVTEAQSLRSRLNERLKEQDDEPDNAQDEPKEDE